MVRHGSHGRKLARSTSRRGRHETCSTGAGLLQMFRPIWACSRVTTASISPTSDVQTPARHSGIRCESVTQSGTGGDCRDVVAYEAGQEQLVPVPGSFRRRSVSPKHQASLRHVERRGGHGLHRDPVSVDPGQSVRSDSFDELFVQTQGANQRVYPEVMYFSDSALRCGCTRTAPRNLNFGPPQQ